MLLVSSINYIPNYRSSKLNIPWKSIEVTSTIINSNDIGMKKHEFS